MAESDYYPEWIDQLDENVVLQAAVLNADITGRDQVRKILQYARTLYEFQDFRFAGRYDDGWIEEYRSKVRGVTTHNIAIIHYNDQGRVDQLVMNHRPLSAMLRFSQLVGEHFGDEFGPDMFYRPSGQGV
ncbi:hypothetical protein ACIBF5_25125 [Micromonospora sp. NPDC050417]|uniref:hypothetical protein n=1 Tax=Micromonospora sp. NPDC050417 TaxID=3364280 RepID=UPI0037A791EC